MFNQVANILATTPATSCSAERSFSALRRMKTYLRSTMGQTRLNSLAILNTERKYSNMSVVTDVDQIIDIFASRKGRKQYLLIVLIKTLLYFEYFFINKQTKIDLIKWLLYLAVHRLTL